MEEAERRNGAVDNLTRICQPQNSVQLSGHRHKVSSSSDTCINNNNNHIFVLALVSPSYSPITSGIRIRRSRSSDSRYRNSNPPVVSPYFTSKAVNVGNDNSDVAHVVSPYFTKNHSCNSNGNTRKIEGVNVGSDNCDVAPVVSPYFGKKDESFMGKEDGNVVEDDDRMRNVVVKGKRRKRVRADGEDCLEDGNVELRGVHGRGNGESGYGMALVKREEMCEDVVKEKKDLGIGEVLRVESNTVKERDNEAKCSGVEEEELLVGDSNLWSVISEVKDIMPSKGKRSKKKRLNTQSGRVELSGVERTGKDGTGHGIEEGTMHVKEGNLSSGISVVKQEKNLEDFAKVKDTDTLRENVVSKCKKNKRRRVKVGADDIMGASLREVERRGETGTSDRTEIVEQHVGEGNLLREVSMVKHEEKREHVVKVEDIDLTGKGVVSKGKRSKKRGENVATGKVEGGLLSKVEEREEGSCHGEEEGEDCVGERNNLAGLPVVKEKRKNLGKQKESKRTIHNIDLTSTDDMRVVSPYFVKMDDDQGGSDDKEQIKKKKKRKKKTVEIDRACTVLERDALHVVSSTSVAPFLPTEGANGHEKLELESMKNGAEQKVKKHRKSKERRACLGDQELETKKKLKEERKIEKRSVLNKCCTKRKKQNKTSGLGSQSDVLSDLITEREGEAVPEVGLRELTSKSATSGFEEASCHRDLGAEIKLKHDSVVSEMKNNCENYTELQEGTSPCSKNVRRMRVKSEKNDMNKDDQVSSGDVEACSKTLRRSIKNSKKINKKASPTSKDLLEAGQQDVLECSAVRNRKEDCIHEDQSCLHASPTLNASPYFQKLSVNEVSEDERDEAYHKIRSKTQVDKAALKEFDELISKYAYKSSTANIEGDNVDEDEANNDLAGAKPKRKKKQKRGIANTTLTRAEKFSEAYKRKAANNTWKPPSSPYNLLQEDHAHDPWRVLVICMLLNITTGPQVRKVLSLFFRRFPNAEAALNTNEIEISIVIQSLGLHRKRAAMIQRFSREYLSDEWTHVTQLHGIGKYAADAYAIFCNGMWDQVTPNDHMLNYYWKFLQTRGFRVREISKT